MAKMSYKRVITFRPDAELGAAMDALKARDGIPVSEQIRRAMREWLTGKGIRVTATPSGSTRQKIRTKTKRRPAGHSPYSSFRPIRFPDGTHATLLFRLPAKVPPDRVLVHNHHPPTRSLTGLFHAWLQRPAPDKLVACDCGWEPKLGQHFRERTPGENLKERRNR